MPRTTKEAVRAIAPALESMPDETLDAMIAAAHTSVNKLAGSSCGSEMTEDDLTQIETWLSAHYATIADPKSSGTTQEKFEGSQKPLRYLLLMVKESYLPDMGRPRICFPVDV